MRIDIELITKGAYLDLTDSNYVFKALLGYGMFTSKLPPCFTSLPYFEYIKDKPNDNKPSKHNFIEYQSTRHTTIPRVLAIPHPELYWNLCRVIQENWREINLHIGKPNVTFNYCHVRKLMNKPHIFEMNELGYDKWHNEDNEINYMLGCRYVVLVGISNCFPSIYSHSIPWAINDKEWAKKHMCTCNNKRKSKGQNCGRNKNIPCPNELKDVWANDLDEHVRSLKDGETNGLLIGPHASNIISEIILTQVDIALQNKGFAKVIRNIDDYTFYATSELDAQNFLRVLTTELKKYELQLNAKKTTITPYIDNINSHWISKLNQFTFPDKAEVGFTIINSYIDYSLTLSLKLNDYAPLKYAIKVISGKQLTRRASRLYVCKMLQVALDKPYILPIIEDNILIFTQSIGRDIEEFLRYLLSRSVTEAITDALAYTFYFALKYNVDLKINLTTINKVLELNDCISIILLYKYCKDKEYNLKVFRDKAKELKELPHKDNEKYWLFIYEVLSMSDQSVFFKSLKENNISFFRNEFI